MSAFELLAKMDRLGIRVWADGEQLRFDAPTGTWSAELRAELQQHKSQMLKLLSADHTSGPSAEQIKSLPRGRGFPLSFAQQRLWLMAQIEPENPFYIVPATFRVAGRLDVDALHHALNEIVARHEALRTTFVYRDNEPVQVVSESQAIEFVITDLSGLPADERDAELQRAVRQAATQPLDLTRSPLFRAKLLRLAEQDHALLLTMHHIVVDGWSLGILLDELRVLYEAFRVGDSPELPALPIQYADFAVWQRQWMRNDRLQSQLDYWKRQLSGAATLQLSTDLVRPPVQTFRGARETIVLDTESAQALLKIGNREGATLFMSLLTAFNILLHRYTGQDDIVVGSPIANRNHPEIEGLIGFFVNNLVLRTDVSGDPSFCELLSRVREVALDAYEHQDIPFEFLVDELELSRDASRNPLFQVTLALQNVSLAPIVLTDITLTWMPVTFQSTRFDLEVNACQSADGLGLAFDYNTDIFKPATIRRLKEHYRRLLQSIVQDPHQRISKLDLMSGAERQLVSVAWNKTDREPDHRGCVHDVFADRVLETPESVAVVSEDRSLTYRELNDRANQLAHHLAQRNVRPGSLVAAFMERSCEMIVGLLGILKAGAAYVPLDPDCPAERLEVMLEDSQARVVLTQKHLIEKLPANARREVICLDADWSSIARQPRDNPDHSVAPSDLAYMIYTSGSSGQPKGVMIPHRAIHALVVNTDYIQLGPHDVVAQAASCSFDAATFEIWGALLNGSRLVVLSRDTTLSAEALRETVRQDGITTLFLTTALFNQIARVAPNTFHGLTNLLFGGEKVDPHCVRQVLEHGSPDRLLHVYGPTETTTFAAWFQVVELDDDALTVPIGRPTANTRLYVLDRQRNPVPVGVPGELFIGGLGTARGYWNDPQLTEEKFVRHSFGSDHNARLYRTGDNVRWLPDATLEFLGRFDHQIKIRGFRVELGEVETAIREHVSVLDAVVVLDEQPLGDKRLVAYVVFAPGEIDSTLVLREHLKRKLPAYMLPAAMIELDALPLTDNGKVDRDALPAHTWTRSELTTEFASPRTDIEKTLADIWMQALGIERVGIHDNFFELGGDSILGVRIVSRAKSAGIKITPKSIFEHQTIAELASVAELLAADEVSEPVAKRDQTVDLGLAKLDEDEMAKLSALIDKVDGEAS